MSLLRMIYLALAIWGAIHPMYYFVSYMRDTGSGLPGLVDAWYVNASTHGLVWDLTIAAIALTSVLYSCGSDSSTDTDTDSQTPSELLDDAGEGIDNAVDDAQDTINNALDDAGDTLNNAVEGANDAVNDAVDSATSETE